MNTTQTKPAAEMRIFTVIGTATQTPTGTTPVPSLNRTFPTLEAARDAWIAAGCPRTSRSSAVWIDEALFDGNAYVTERTITMPLCAMKAGR